MKHRLLSSLPGTLGLCLIGLTALAQDRTPQLTQPAPGDPGAKQVTVSSLQQLAQAAGQSGQTVRMAPGLYPLTDFIPLTSIPDRRKRREYQWMTFSGSNNVFRLDNVVIVVDTALREALRPPMHNSEFIVSGHNNLIQGLCLTNVGNGTSPGGAVLSISGTRNTLRNCTLHVRGSFPYGYGDLFGKGGGSVIHHRKQSGMHITGNHTRLYDCHLTMRSFGHGFYVQEDAANVHFENCTVEGEMRSTDDMLAETSGPAFDVEFRTVMRNRAGVHRVTPGYMKSLAEDGFRTYGQHENLTFKNCTATHMRGGFELRSKTGVRVENCAAIGNERGFWVSSDATVVNCRGDARHGPLLFVEGDNASVNVELLPTESHTTVHALATLYGSGHRVTLTPADHTTYAPAIPIMLGYGPPGAGEGMSPIGERPARNVTLRNETPLSVIISAQSAECSVQSVGPIEQNLGRAISSTRLSDASAE